MKFKKRGRIHSVVSKTDVQNVYNKELVVVYTVKIYIFKLPLSHDIKSKNRHISCHLHLMSCHNFSICLSATSPSVRHALLRLVVAATLPPRAPLGLFCQKRQCRARVLMINPHALALHVAWNGAPRWRRCSVRLDPPQHAPALPLRKTHR